MANTKSAQKNIRKTATRTEQNRQLRTRLKSMAKKVSDLSDNPAEAKDAAVRYVSYLDKAAKRGIIHANNARRHKASVSKFIFAKTA